MSHVAYFIRRITRGEVKFSIEACVGGDERGNTAEEEETSCASSPQYWFYCSSTKWGAKRA